MSNRTARRSPTRRTGTPLYALLVLALSFGYGHRSLAQQTTVPALGTIDGVTLTTVDTNEFILDAPPSRIQSIIERHNLTIIRSLDSHGHGVYLVRANGTVPYTDLVNQVASDPEVSHFELNNLAIAPEVPSGLHLDQSPVAILDALSDRTIVDYHGKPTWSRYVTQPATAVIRMADAHSTYGTGAGIVAVIDTGVDPNHPQLQDVLVPGYDFVNDTAGTASEWTDLDPAAAATLNQSPVAILDQSPVAILDQSPVAILDRQSLIVSLNQSTVAVLTPATAGALNPAAPAP